MPRPRKCRMVNALPEVSYFKPRGVPMKDLLQVRLDLEGYEALRLADIEGLEHEQAAEAMGVSRQTFGRVLAEARRSVAEAVVLGKALSIEGGHYRLPTTQKGAPEPGGTRARWVPVRQAKERTMNLIAVSCEGDTPEDRVDPRFGRAGGFVLLNPPNPGSRYLDNGAAVSMGQGAGIQAAETLAKAGVSVVLTGFVGPKAFQALRAAGIQIVQDMEGMSARQAVERFLAGQVKPAEAPNRQGRGR